MRLVPRHRLYVDRRHGHRLLALEGRHVVSQESITDDEPGSPIGRIWIYQSCGDMASGDWSCDWEAFFDVESAIDRYETMAKRIYNNLLEMHQQENAQGQKRFTGDSELFDALTAAAKHIAEGEVSEAIYEMTDWQLGHVGEAAIMEIFETNIYP